MNKCDTKKFDKGGVQMIAHRGLSGIEKENTCAAFVAAGNRSYFGIETDVHRTSDGRFVIIHDDNTDRVAGVDHEIEQTDFDTLRQLKLNGADNDIARSDLHIPTLGEYISICKKYGKIAVLELKNPFSAEDIGKIAAVIDEFDYFDSVIFISFCLENLIELKIQRPAAEAQWLTGEFNDDVFRKLAEYGIGIDIYWEAVTEAMCERVHSIGQKVNCWTVNETEHAGRMKAAGVDYITSNILE